MTMKNHFLLCIVIILFSGNPLFAQVSLTNDGSSADPSAMLDVKSTTRGLLIPRMSTTERNNIISPVEGLMIFNLTTGCFEAFNAGTSGWETIHCFECPIPATPGTGIHVPSQTQIVWNWNTVPDAIGYKWNTVNNSLTATDMGMITTKMETGLTCSTAYTRYAWAYNACGNSTALNMNQTTSACPFTCGQTMTDSRDGKSYNTVLIGTQCWMAQNLNIGAKINGSDDQTNNNIIEKYCYNDLESNCDVYGGLYQWAEMVQYLNGATNTTSWSPVPTGNVLGICPSGWHFPTDAEWSMLTTFIGGEGVAGGKMKEPGYSHWLSPNTGATNSSGFTALPGGFRYFTGVFANLGTQACLGSSSENTSAQAYYRILFNTAASMGRDGLIKTAGFSGRCIQD
jgi:uncharacterized protein (TIGR02145 family)